MLNLLSPTWVRTSSPGHGTWQKKQTEQGKSPWTVSGTAFLSGKTLISVYQIFCCLIPVWTKNFVLVLSWSMKQCWLMFTGNCAVLVFITKWLLISGQEKTVEEIVCFFFEVYFAKIVLGACLHSFALQCHDIMWHWLYVQRCDCMRTVWENNCCC